MSLDPTNLGKVASAVPGSIREAAKSSLGFAALATIVLCILAYSLFDKSNDTVKILIFLVLLASILFFFISAHFLSPSKTSKPGPLVQPPLGPVRDKTGR